MGHRIRQAVEDREQPVHARVRQDPADRRAPRSNPQLPAGDVRVFKRHDQRTEGVPVAGRQGRQVHHDDRAILADGHEGFPEALGVPGVDRHQRGDDRQATVGGDPDTGLAGTGLVGTGLVGTGLVDTWLVDTGSSGPWVNVSCFPPGKLGLSAVPPEHERMRAAPEGGCFVNRAQRNTPVTEHSRFSLVSAT